jgi:hypothetical protein
MLPCQSITLTVSVLIDALSPGHASVTRLVTKSRHSVSNPGGSHAIVAGGMRVSGVIGRLRSPAFYRL